jgi:hypothetical protein
MFSICNAEEKTKEEQKWEGFRGIKWGTNINNIENMVLEEEGEMKHYSRSTDNLKIGSSVLDHIIYSFYKNSFCDVYIRTTGYSNFKHLKDAIFTYYGKGYQDNEYIEDWLWDKYDVLMVLKYNEFSEETVFYIFYKPILLAKDADDAKKAKDAEKDF